MLLTKIISGTVIAAAIVLSALFFKLAWFGMVIFLSITGTWELARMLKQKGVRTSFWLPALLNFFLLGGSYLLVDSDFSRIVQDWNIGHAHVLAWANLFMVFAALTLITQSLFLRDETGTKGASMLELAVPLFQITWLGWFPCFFILLRAIPGGEFYLIWGLTSVAFSDIGAYFAGKYLGKRPYFKHLSPNKTIEGSVGGIFASIAVAQLLALAFGKWLPIPWYHNLILAAGMACLGQVGDLIESMVKRDMGVKDSGDWLPGFGGLLDRIDAYLLLAPFMYFYLTNFVMIKS